MNVRRGVPGLQPDSWSCRYCAVKVRLADAFEQQRRLDRELDRITREAVT